MNNPGFWDARHTDLFVMLLISIIFIGVLIAFWPLMGAIVLSASVAIVLMPTHKKICKNFSERKSAIFLTLLVFILSTELFLFTAGMLYREADFILDMISAIISWVRLYPAISLISPEQIAAALEIIADFIYDYIQGLALSLPSVLLNAFIFYTSLYLFILKGDNIKNELLSVLPQSLTASIGRVSHTIGDTLYAVYIVNLQVAVITFVLAIPFFMFLGYGNVLFFALLMGIFQLIPFLGPQIIIVFLTVYAVALGDVTGAILIVFIGYPLMSGLEDFYLRPMMMGSRIAIHSVLMMIGIFGGLALLGILGLILGPLFVALLVCAYHLLVDQLGCAKRGETG